MASSSSTSSAHKKSYLYDVFLSFSGEDTRRTFIDHLYTALVERGIETFKDDKKLQKGKRINDELLQSIEDLRLYIIVFSKNYASSSWCPNELLKIMECQNKKERIAYPVFYDVEPTEVRKQIGSVGEALSIHKNESEVGVWREALKEAAALSGWDLKKNADGHEAQVIRLIVEKVWRDLCPFNYVNIDEKKLVGMEQRMHDLELLLNIGVDDVRMVGIKGMGGAGKTTLARAIYDNEISSHFDAKIFIENVRAISKESSSGLLSLQKQLLSNLLNLDTNKLTSVFDGRKEMQKRMPSKKVLVVLDDVDQLSQLEALAGDNSWFKPGSRVIITTRDEQVLLSHRVNLIHQVGLLSNKEATHLFSRYAFGKDVPVREYEKESLEVVCYAAGLPLILKVLGSLLCGKDKLEWIDTLARLKAIPLEDTVKVLELSYESLQDDHKEIFLDVACLLKNWKMEDAIQMLDACGFHARYGLRVLQRKSLITFEEVYETEYFHPLRSARCERVTMHDHIEEMGKNIVRRLHRDDPCRHSRLWIQDEIEDVLAHDIGTEETRCIRMELTFNIDLTGLLNMNKLRCLIVNYDTISSSYSDYVTDGHKDCKNLPKTLRYLYWRHYQQDHRCLPIISEANDLVALDIYNSKIEQIWEGGMAMNKLRYLVLNDCRNLQTLPDSICKLKHLKTLTLHHCAALQKLPEDLGKLASLEVLDLSWCESIREIPSSIGKLKRLKTLSLLWCEKIKKLPKELGHLERLNVLRLESCGIKELPGDFGQLGYLEELSLQNCTSLKHLPNNICKSKHLKTLALHGCCALEKLPEDLGKLESL